MVVATLKRGFLFSPEIVYNYTEHDLNNLIMVIEKEIGLTAEKIIITEHSDKPLEKRAQTAFLFGRNKYIEVRPIFINRSLIIYTFKLENNTIYIHIPSEDVVLP